MRLSHEYECAIVRVQARVFEVGYLLSRLRDLRCIDERARVASRRDLCVVSLE